MYEAQRPGAPHAHSEPFSRHSGEKSDLMNENTLSEVVGMAAAGQQSQDQAVPILQPLGVWVSQEAYIQAEVDRRLMQERLRILEAQVTAQATAFARTPFVSPAPSVPAVMRSSKHPDPDKFDGNKATYEIFRSQLVQKLLANADWFVDEQARMSYSYSRLNGVAAEQICPYIDRDLGVFSFKVMRDFLKILDATFVDLNRVTPALGNPKTLHQGNRGNGLPSKESPLKNTPVVNQGHPENGLPSTESPLKSTPVGNQGNRENRLPSTEPPHKNTPVVHQGNRENGLPFKELPHQITPGVHQANRENGLPFTESPHKKNTPVVHQGNRENRLPFTQSPYTNNTAVEHQGNRESGRLPFTESSYMNTVVGHQGNRESGRLPLMESPHKNTPVVHQGNRENGRLPPVDSPHKNTPVIHQGNRENGLPITALPHKNTPASRRKQSRRSPWQNRECPQRQYEVMVNLTVMSNHRSQAPSTHHTSSELRFKRALRLNRDHEGSIYALLTEYRDLIVMENQLQQDLLRCHRGDFCGVDEA